MFILRFIANIIWILFGGIELFFGWLIAALFCIPFVITWPFIKPCLNNAMISLFPHSYEVVDDKEQAGTFDSIGNVIWFIFIGWWLALSHIFFAITQALTIIGIPNCIAVMKMLPLTMAPYNKIVVKEGSRD